MIDYALKITQAPDGQTRCEWLFASDVRGDVEVVRNSGALYSEWRQTFYDNLQMCGDTDPVPNIPDERWARANKFRHTPIRQTNSSRGQVEKFRCPRCLAGNFRGLTQCIGCTADFALPIGSVIHYPDPERANSDREQSHALMIH